MLRPAILRWPLMLLPIGVATAVAAAGLAVFQPWKLWLDTTVNEALPTVSAPSEPGPSPSSAPSPSVDPSPSSVPSPTATTAATAIPGPVDLAAGTLISHEHDTTGSVRIVRLPDGSRILRLENLDTSNGPDLRVWLTDAPVIPGRDGWHVFDDGAHVSLGPLKGNRGSQNYVLPAAVDLSRYSSVTIWCDRFNVSFGAARLASA